MPYTSKNASNAQSHFSTKSGLNLQLTTFTKSRSWQIIFITDLYWVKCYLFY